MAGEQSKLRVRFAPTPHEARLYAMIEGLLLLALFWPVLLPWRALMLGERLAASALGAYLGLLHGGAFAAAFIAHLLFSRGGVRRLLWGADSLRMTRAVSVPVPGTPPPEETSADRLPSDGLHSAISAALAAAVASAPATEPAVPSPLTPPVVAPSALEPSPPPPAAATPAARASRLPATPGSGRQTQQHLHPHAHPGLAAAYARAIAESGAPGGPPSLGAAVEAWQQGLETSAGEGGAHRRQLSWEELQRKEGLAALQEREEELLAAFEPAGPQAAQAAAAWLEASEPAGALYPPTAPAAATAAAGRPPRSTSAASLGRAPSAGSSRSAAAERMASYPLADLLGQPLSDEEEAGMQAAVAGGAAEATRGAAHDAAAAAVAAEVAAGAELAGGGDDDAMELTAHTKREQR